MTHAAAAAASPKPSSPLAPSSPLPLRVLHVSAGKMYGGAEVFLRTLAVARGACEAMVPEFALSFDGRIKGELAEAGVRVHPLGEVRARYPWSVTRARAELARVLERGAFDVVVTHSAWPHAIFAPAVRAAGLPLVLYLHDALDGGHWLERWAARTPPDLLVCNSRYTAGTANKLFARVPRRTVSYPVLFEGAPASPAARRAVRAAQETADDAVVILQVSRMQSWKGQGLLLAALGRMTDEPRWTCWIAGGAQRDEERAYEASLKETAARLGIAGRVKFLGQRSDVPALLRAADIFCQPNESPEPFGIAFVEALSAGLPVVATAMGGALEIVDGSCGLRVPPDAGALAEALRGLVADPAARAKLAAAGPARARALCDVPRQISALADAFSLSSRRGTPFDVAERARQSEGESLDVIHALVRRVLEAKEGRYAHLVDVGCGAGTAARSLAGLYDRYTGVDVVQYAALRPTATVAFTQANLDAPPWPLPDGAADAAVCIETIEHLENPRALMRELRRIVRPGGRIVVTTPNQLSLLSKLYLLTHDQFHAFQEAPGLYPSHITALVEEDLRRIAAECGLVEIETHFTDSGRIPLTPWPWPASLGARGRLFSENVLVTMKRPPAPLD